MTPLYLVAVVVCCGSHVVMAAFMLNDHNIEFFCQPVMVNQTEMKSSKCFLNYLLHSMYNL